MRCLLAGAAALVLTLTGATPALAAPATVTRAYAVDGSVFANPGRGFFTYTETHLLADGSGWVPLDAAALAADRESAGHSLVFRIFYLEKYRAVDTISAADLALIRADLAAVRTDWADRKRVLTALLAAVPATVPVQVRTPQIARRLAPGNTRVGVHDDCFLAGTDDYGTYLAADDRAWLAKAPGLVGGETCDVSDRSGWADASAETAAGSYRLALSLPDPASRLTAVPAYAIRLASTGVWDATTGRNSLGATLTVAR
ncbi:DUF4832 domain-containing protein [Actinoplanes derwentensis]|uniref:Secreted protein n=1 Tax=Actinoplanes derwentensis TaxID=113562 RepID=A0A1H2BMK3_9ACTN|nr:DUF4832 domain-containing protein [Actinoplanes derwentensis]GID86876.1 hypothetical protein Ade03nite_58000 [Actinoplanes derwentensis]SDT59354.1 hypothetical protein SAMN04489716_4732 [Actinoplanes derwentensis]